MQVWGPSVWNHYLLKFSLVSEHPYSFTPLQIHVSAIVRVFPCLDSFVPKLMYFPGWFEILCHVSHQIPGMKQNRRSAFYIANMKNGNRKPHLYSSKMKSYNICHYCGGNLVSFPECEENVVSNNRHCFGINSCPKPLPVISSL